MMWLIPNFSVAESSSGQPPFRRHQQAATNSFFRLVPIHARLSAMQSKRLESLSLGKPLLTRTLHDRFPYFFGWDYLDGNGRQAVPHRYVGIGTLISSGFGIFRGVSRTRSDDPSNFLDASERADSRRPTPMLHQAALGCRVMLFHSFGRTKLPKAAIFGGNKLFRDRSCSSFAPAFFTSLTRNIAFSFRNPLCYLSDEHSVTSVLARSSC